MKRHDRDDEGRGDEVRVEDRRHWATRADLEDAESEPAPPVDTPLAQAERRAQEAETKLREYVAAFRQHEAEHEAFRTRMLEDVDRRVELRFGQLVGELLEMVDDLNRGLAHVEDDSDPLAQGVTMARDRFLATLERHGVETIVPDGQPFDPHVAEAIRVDPVDAPEEDGRVTETMAPGYRLGDRVIRPARVAVGRHAG
jgi:molecular chaperone GrpE (heat shock protein)